MEPIEDNKNDTRYVETYELKRPDGSTFELEYVQYEDWGGLSEPCPECHGTEFNHVRYEGGHYGQHQGVVVERTDYWYQQGGLYTECRGCDEVLYKHPAYELIKAWSDEDRDLLER